MTKEINEKLEQINQLLLSLPKAEEMEKKERAAFAERFSTLSIEDGNTFLQKFIERTKEKFDSSVSNRILR